MRLGEWLAANGVGQAEFGAIVGLSQSQVSRLVAGRRGKRLPFETALAIERATGGKVPASEWGSRRRSALHHKRSR